FGDRPHPARHGTAQRRAARGAEHRTRPAASAALGGEHQVGEVVPPVPHGPTVPTSAPPGHPCGQLAGPGGTGPVTPRTGAALTPDRPVPSPPSPSATGPPRAAARSRPRSTPPAGPFRPRR